MAANFAKLPELLRRRPPTPASHQSFQIVALLRFNLPLRASDLICNRIRADRAAHIPRHPAAQPNKP